MTLAERAIAEPTVSLSELLRGDRPPIGGRTEIGLRDYVQEILGSGFPAIRPLAPALRQAQLDGYLERIVERDFQELGHGVRKPASLMRWMRAYAAATATTASYEKIRDAATSGIAEKPAKATTLPYLDILERLWILDSLPAWLPTREHLSRLAAPPKHHLADPALAARLLDVDANGLLSGRAAGPVLPRQGTLLGALFESLLTLCVRVYAQAARAHTAHLRTWRGEHEVNLIVERDARVLALEVKLGQVPEDRDVRHLLWLAERLGDDLADAVVLTSGPVAYRRPDGIAVVPAVLLGP